MLSDWWEYSMFGIKRNGKIDGNRNIPEKDQLEHAAFEKQLGLSDVCYGLLCNGNFNIIIGHDIRKQGLFNNLFVRLCKASVHLSPVKTWHEGNPCFRS